MLILGHAGITLGAAVLLKGILIKSYSPRRRVDRVIEHPMPPGEASSSQDYSPASRTSWLTSLGKRIDIRLLLIGSLLPDIIDKPIGQFFFKDTFSNGRIFPHTLLFLAVITLVGFYLYKSHGKLWLLVLSLGTLAHLILDQMWLESRTLLWPVYGVAFEKLNLTHWLQNILYALLTDPSIYLPELIGTTTLIWFALVLVRRRKFYAFIRNGQVL